MLLLRRFNPIEDDANPKFHELEDKRINAIIAFCVMTREVSNIWNVPQWIDKRREVRYSISRSGDNLRQGKEVVIGHAMGKYDKDSIIIAIDKFLDRLGYFLNINDPEWQFVADEILEKRYTPTLKYSFI